jgi:hypothetical protein
MAVRGDAPQLIQTRAGHSDYSTTLRYIRAAEAVREGFGEVFPALPDMAKEPVHVQIWAKFEELVPNYMTLQRGGRDSNAQPTYPAKVSEESANAASKAADGGSSQFGFPASAPTTTDDAIRLAAKLAIDAGEYPRARALIDLLEQRPISAPVLALATTRVDR